MSVTLSKVPTVLKPALLLLALSVLTLFSPVMHAAVVIDVVESGGNVVATATGSINTSALVNKGSAGGDINSSFIFGSSNYESSGILLGSVNAVDIFQGINESPLVFSTGGGFYASSASGDLVGAGSITSLLSELALDATYVSGAPMSGTSTWNGQTFNSIGLIPGTYVYTWGAGATADSLTINIGSVTPPQTYIIGGTVTGLMVGTSVTLQNNGGDDITLTINGGFAYTAQAQGSTYAVTVSSQPLGQTCSVSNGSGTISNANVTNISVVCTDDDVAPPPPAAPAAPIPTLSEWALIVLTMLLGLMVFANRKRLL